MVGVMRIRRSLRAQIVAVLLVGCVIGAPPGVAHRLRGAEPAPTDDNAATTIGSAPGSPTAPARTDESDAGRAGVEPAETEPGCDGAEAGAASGAPAASGAAAAVATVPAARTPRRANRLAREQSPYLRQHQFNPVDWYPWGPAAFEKARTENKPIFLSIGYSSCYWCHVMDRKVFQNEELAAYLNEHFVCIKVDREERPELDEIYMTSLIVYLQAIGAPASGGWPLSMFLTPDGRPIAGGTYFPPEDTDKQMGFRTVTSRIVSLWSQSQSKLEQNASVLSTETRRLLNPPITPKSSAKLDESLVAVVVKEVVASADPEHGGLDFDVNSPDAAKFPVPQKLLLLLSEQSLTPNAELGEITDAALEQMALGGIRDHLGGGFHRYSVDRAWNVPHFEKMLYDQAQLLEAYAVAYTQTNNPLYRTVAEEIVAFVDRELTSPQGGFYTAIDAESSGVEGAAYVWTAEEIERALGADAAAFMTLYGVTSKGPPSAGAPELYVLRLANADEATLAEVERLRSARERLLTKRLGRTQPLRDDKIVVSSNGLMIRALAIAAEAFQDQTLTDRATRAADYLLTRARPSQGPLKHVITQNEPRLNAYLDDYAYLIDALLELHRVTKEEVWLKSAISLQQQQDEQFADERGGYFFAPSDHEQLLARAKNCYDGVLPAGNSIAARNLVRLAALTSDEGYRQEATRTLQAFLAQLETAPRGSATLARALRAYLQLPATQTSGGKSTKTPRATPTLAVNMDDEAVNSDDEAHAAAEGARTALAEEDASSDTVPARGTKANSGGDASAGRNIRQASNEEDALPTADAEAPAEKVTMKAYLSVDRFPAGRTCRLAVLLDVAEGWHINANPPIPENVKPTVVKFKSKRGVKLTKIKYPKGEMLSVAGEPEPQAVYSGQVRIDGILEIPADAAGQDDEMEIELQFQACDDNECLLPKTIKLTGKLKVAEVDEDVRAVNEKLFKPAK